MKTRAVEYEKTLATAFKNYRESEGESYEAARKAEAIAILFMLSTGFRVSDARTAKWEDIDFRGVDVKGSFRKIPTVSKKVVKTGESLTLLLVDSDVVRVLEEYYEWLKLKFKIEDLQGHLILANYKASKKGDKAFTNAWLHKRIGILTGLEGGIGSHSLRKAFAHKIYNERKHLPSVQSLLGHANVRTTSIYLEVEKTDALQMQYEALSRSKV